MQFFFDRTRCCWVQELAETRPRVGESPGGKFDLKGIQRLKYCFLLFVRENRDASRLDLCRTPGLRREDDIKRPKRRQCVSDGSQILGGPFRPPLA